MAACCLTTCGAALGARRSRCPWKLRPSCWFQFHNLSDHGVMSQNGSHMHIMPRRIIFQRANLLMIKSFFLHESEQGEAWSSLCVFRESSVCAEYQGPKATQFLLLIFHIQDFILVTFPSFFPFLFFFYIFFC